MSSCPIFLAAASPATEGDRDPSEISARRTRPPARAFVAIAASLLFAACVSEPSAITGQKKSFGYSWEQEQQLGSEADKEITAEMGLYENPQLQAYVEAIGQRVLQTSTLRAPNAPEMYRDTKFVFRVMDSPVVNAFALPGGYVYVTRGLLTHVQNEAQLAVVLGHEIAHVAARHSSQQAKRAQIGQIGLIAGAILGQQVLGDRGGDIASSVMQMGGQALQMFMLRYSREAENESDTLGVGYASRAGYAAAESARFFHSLQRIGEAEGKSLPSWQSTHPDPGDRAQHVQQLAAAQMQPGIAPMIGEEEYLRRIEGIVVGEDPREGFSQNGIFYHPTLRFQFATAPGWKVQNEKAAVILVDPNKQAAMGFRMSPAARAREAAAKFVEESKVQVTNSGDTMVNGLPTTVIIGQATTEQGAVGVWNAFIEMNGRVFSFLGYSPTAAFTQMRPTFEAVAGSFGPLRDPRMASVQPARLRLVRAERPAAFASFVPTSLPATLTPDAVAIMNQVQLNESIAPGRLLKIPDPTMTATTWNAATAPPPAYPQQPGAYPQQPSSYPAQSPAYPPGSYPPASGYPPASSYPNQPGYPPTPPQNYPPTPGGWPQTQPQGPVWPR